MNTERTDNANHPADGSPIILWDDRCTVCARLKTRVDRRLEHCGYRFESLWAARRSNPEISPDEMHLLLTDGRHLGGIDAVLHLSRRIWWLWPLVALRYIPGGYRAMRAGYRWFARNRYRFGCNGGDACATKPERDD